MPTFGPWVQDDDFTAGYRTNPGDPGTVDGSVLQGGISEVEYRQGGSHVTLTASDYYTAEAQALTTPAAASIVGDAGWQVNSQYGASGFPTVFSSTVLAQVDYAILSASPWQSFVNRYQPTAHLVAPDGAIGYQWQDDESTFIFDGSTGTQYKVATPVGLVIQDISTLSGMSEWDGDFMSPVSAGGFSTDVRVTTGDFLSDSTQNWATLAGGDTIQSWGGGGSGDVVHTETLVSTVGGAVVASDVRTLPEIDLTAHMDAQGRAVIFTRTDTLLAPTDLTAPQDDQIRYGYTFEDAYLSWTLRPPVFRWILESRVLPPQRVFPREDGLLTSSGQRIHPKPRSRQRSPRIGGGYF